MMTDLVMMGDVWDQSRVKSEVILCYFDEYGEHTIRCDIHHIEEAISKLREMYGANHA